MINSSFETDEKMNKCPKCAQGISGIDLFYSGKIQCIVEKMEKYTNVEWAITESM